MDFGHVRLDGQRLAEQFDRVLTVALLVAQHAEQVQRGGMQPILSQDLLVQDGGLVEQPGLVVCDGGLEYTVHGQALAVSETRISPATNPRRRPRSDSQRSVPVINSSPDRVEGACHIPVGGRLIHQPPGTCKAPAG